ncbi:MAG: hypothetical protein EPN93_12800 [Spirochaetes bacterium]|nr:MAG: hypothetical protein EPN93_12800 [Spirochaetota bacterium]
MNLPARTVRYALLAAASLFVAFAACGRDYESSIRKGAGLYQEGKKDEGLRAMEEGIVRGSAAFSFDAPLPEGGDTLYRKTASGTRVVHPADVTLKGIAEFDAIACGKDSVALVKGNDLALFDLGGKFISADTLPPSKEKTRTARALAWTGDDLMVFCDGRLFRYSPRARSFKPFLPRESFAPPYGDSGYRASFILEGGTLLLILGMGGQYNLSALGIEKETMLFKNKPVSSSRLISTRDRLYYIAGSAGAWILAAYAFETKAVKELATMGDLVDITLLGSGALFETRDGIFFTDYARPSEGITLPFSFRARGRSGPHIIIEQGGALFLIDEKRFLDLLAVARGELPHVFVAKKQAAPAG